MSKLFVSSTLAVLLCTSLAAQATQTPAPSPSTPGVAQPATDIDRPQTPAAPPAAAPRATAKADTLTVTGCIEPSVNAVSATPDAVGTAGRSVSTATAFILTSVGKGATGTSGSSASSESPTYQLAVEDSKLIPHVGHKVEITGTLVAPDAKAATAAASGSGAPAPTLKVENVKMVAATCN